jgi:hypothetical protein
MLAPALATTGVTRTRTTVPCGAALDATSSAAVPKTETAAKTPTPLIIAV